MTAFHRALGALLVRASDIAWSRTPDAHTVEIRGISDRRAVSRDRDLVLPIGAQDMDPGAGILRRIVSDA